nr:uncharacterized protein LOC106691939 [Halyomorpha halys]
MDYRKLNEAIKDKRYPLPRVEDILDRLEGATVFSTLDLKHNTNGQTSGTSEIDDIINSKRHQVIIRSKQDPGIETRASTYEGLSTILVRAPESIDENALENIFTEFANPGRNFVYAGNRLITEKLKRLWQLRGYGWGIH